MSEQEKSGFLDNKDLVSIMTVLITLIMKYGLPYVLDILNGINNNLITKEDIDNLRITKSPEDYFKK